jgi:RNA polymerase sigma-70 factor (ECF subfamily)
MASGAPVTNTAPDSEFEQWYAREHSRVFTALAVAAGDADVAREATDEAFVRAYERWARVKQMDSPGGWLYRVALNEMRRRLRRRSIERELLRRRRLPTAAEPAPISDPRVWAAVGALPERQRSAVALRYVLDLTEREVAATMGITRGAASATLSSARLKLQRSLGEAVTDNRPTRDGQSSPDGRPTRDGQGSPAGRPTARDGQGCPAGRPTARDGQASPDGEAMLALCDRTIRPAVLDG